MDLENRKIGKETMSPAMHKAMNYHRFIYSCVQPFLGARVWEIGCGYGQYTRMLLEDKRSVFATDIDSALLSELQLLKDAHFPELSIGIVDLEDRNMVGSVRDWRPDTVLCLNVLEHIENDSNVLRVLHDDLLGAVTAIFLVPAFQWLYGYLDREAGHFRRYTRESIEIVFQGSGWVPRKSFYLNSIGALAWFLRGRACVPKNKSLDSIRVSSDIDFFDRYLVQPTKAIDNLTSSFFGLSVILVADKT